MECSIERGADTTERSGIEGEGVLACTVVVFVSERPWIAKQYSSSLHSERVVRSAHTPTPSQPSDPTSPLPHTIHIVPPPVDADGRLIDISLISILHFQSIELHGQANVPNSRDESDDDESQKTTIEDLAESVETVTALSTITARPVSSFFIDSIWLEPIFDRRLDPSLP
ncbi:hypothetical protein BLNAU_19600 [Blattamonas nauphoetae]|uniref:Uncharacterized protein n=1 Tax=Blattamonas nauphoetae TaxID=2049346 RepID=A0ABQ9X114_9EUKA|nr:hypothetical protein BLNAU_19600 [Blattamonas nauphoetae]